MLCTANNPRTHGMGILPETCHPLTSANLLALRTSRPTRTDMAISRPCTTANQMPLGRWNVHGRSMLMESLRPTLLPAHAWRAPGLTN